MAIVKAAALHEWLLRLNFSIFNLQLNTGDWIEVAVDWTVSWINQAWDYAEAAYNWARSAWDRAGELYDILRASLESLRTQFEGWFGTITSSLSTWWEARKSEVLSWIDARVSDVNDLLSAVNRSLQALESSWDGFRTSVLPGLLSLDWFRSWWGDVGTTFSAWWSAALRRIREDTEARLQPVRDEVNRHTGMLGMLGELFEDPEKWLLDRLESMLARFI